MCLRGPEKQPRVLVFLCHNLKIRNESYDVLKFAKSAEIWYFSIFCAFS